MQTKYKYNTNGNTNEHVKIKFKVTGWDSKLHHAVIANVLLKLIIIIILSNHHHHHHKNIISIITGKSCTELYPVSCQRGWNTYLNNSPPPLFALFTLFIWKQTKIKYNTIPKQIQTRLKYLPQFDTQEHSPSYSTLTFTFTLSEDSLPALIFSLDSWCVFSWFHFCLIKSLIANFTIGSSPGGKTHYQNCYHVLVFALQIQIQIQIQIQYPYILKVQILN